MYISLNEDFLHHLIFHLSISMKPELMLPHQVVSVDVARIHLARQKIHQFVSRVKVKHINGQRRVPNR